MGAVQARFRDGGRWADGHLRTSGKTTYGGGRVVDISIPKGAPPATLTFDLNMAYSFLCAHSDLFNCPLVLTNRVDTELKFGEKYPPPRAD